MSGLEMMKLVAVSALAMGLAGPAAYAVSNIVVTTVATSIVAHGVSAHFLLPAAGSRTAS